MRSGVWLGLGACALVGCAYGVPTDAVRATAEDAGATMEPQGRNLHSVLGHFGSLLPDAAPAPSEGDAAADTDAGASPQAGSSWMTPACDGEVAAAEYGGVQNQMLTPTGQTWFVTWDKTALYVAIVGADVNEALVLYLANAPPGSPSGEAYDGTDVSALPFSASAVVYAKASYNEVRTVSNATWALTGSVTVCTGGTTIREVVIPWSVTGASSLPASFRWMGYLTSSSGYVYGQQPGSNPGKTVGLSATFPHDYFVASTSDGYGSFPFADVE